MYTEHKIEKHPSNYAPQGNKQLVFTQQVPLYYFFKIIQIYFTSSKSSNL